MSDYIVRVIHEQKELKQKITALRHFILSEGFKQLDHENSRLLEVQLIIMGQYNAILLKRIQLF